MTVERSVTDTGLGYVVAFSDSRTASEFIRFEVEDIERVPWGLSATVTVRSRVKDARVLPGGFLTTERVSLLQGRSRMELAQRIGERVPPPQNGAVLDWALLVDEMVMLVLDRNKKPLDVLDMAVVPPAGPEEFLVPRIIAKRHPTIIYASGGTGKSYLAAAMGVAVQSGMPFLGERCEQANVMYLDWEAEPADTSRRIWLTARGLGLEASPHLRYIRLHQAFRYHQNEIAGLVNDPAWPIGFVIIDSSNMAMSGAGSGAGVNEAAIEFYKSLRAMGATVLVIDHLSSEDVKKGKPVRKPMGAVSKGNTARATYELRDTSDEYGPTRVTLQHTKANNTARFPDLSMTIDWLDDRVIFRPDTYEMSEPAPLGERILDLLDVAPSSPRNLVDLVDDDSVGEREVRETLADLKRDGRITVDQMTGVVRMAPLVVDGQTSMEDPR